MGLLWRAYTRGPSRELESHVPWDNDSTRSNSQAGKSYSLVYFRNHTSVGNSQILATVESVFRNLGV